MWEETAGGFASTGPYFALVVEDGPRAFSWTLERLIGRGQERRSAVVNRGKHASFERARSAVELAIHNDKLLRNRAFGTGVIARFKNFGDLEYGCRGVPESRSILLDWRTIRLPDDDKTRALIDRWRKRKLDVHLEFIGARPTVH